MKLGGILVLAAALVLTGCTQAPPPAIPDIQAKADAFSRQVADEKAAAEKKHVEDTTVKVEYPSKSPLRVLFAGDSLTAGYATTAPALAFRELVAAELGKTGAVAQTVAGKPGQTTAEAAPEVAAAGADFNLVVVELGTNDVIKSNPATFTTDYKALLASIRAKSPTAPMVCLGGWNSAAKAKAFDAVIESECTAAGGKYRVLSGKFVVEANRWANGLLPNGTKADNFHPSDKGHAVIAQQVMSAIRFS
ncbi:SGNH/GDSL hydrolase family protein [Arthrobacter sp. CC3]|uniref:SGNH/GDSL hydrolase family protein n=1 Tax=Arthrobacter sp. CC3 TaxID=3029185 RepID=UPI00326301BA